MMWWDHTISPWQGWVNICSLKTLYDRQGAFQVWYWNQSACVLRTPLEEAQLKPSHNILWVRTYSHLSQLLSIPLPFLSLSWRTSASFHPPSSGVRPGIRSSLLHKSLGDCENTEKKTPSQNCVSCRVRSFIIFSQHVTRGPWLTGMAWTPPPKPVLAS